MAPNQSIEEQTLTLYASVGMALSAWSGVEGQLCRLFAQCLDPERFNPMVSSSVAERGFWSVISFDAKLQMTNSTVRESLWFDKEHLAVWANIYNRLGKSSKYRNKIAHGTVVHHHQGQIDGSVVESVYFSPYYWDKDVKVGTMFRSGKESPPERLSAKDIQEATNRFSKLKEETHQLALSIFEKAQQRAGPDRPT